MPDNLVYWCLGALVGAAIVTFIEDETNNAVFGLIGSCFLGFFLRFIGAI
jgi:hypothetical protein